MLQKKLMIEMNKYTLLKEVCKFQKMKEEQKKNSFNKNYNKWNQKIKNSSLLLNN